MAHFEWMDGCLEQISMEAYQRQQGGTNRVCLDTAKYVLPMVIDRELDAEERQCVRMYYFDHFTQAKIAAEIGTSQSAVSRKLARAKKRLEKYLNYSMMAAKKATGE